MTNELLMNDLNEWLWMTTELLMNDVNEFLIISNFNEWTGYTALMTNYFKLS